MTVGGTHGKKIKRQNNNPEWVEFEDILLPNIFEGI